MQQELGYEEPRFAKWLFASPAAGLIWLFVRIYLGYEWMHAGWEKLTGTDGGFWTWHFGYTADSWLRSSAPLQGFTKYAVSGAAQGRLVRVVPGLAQPPGSRSGLLEGDRPR